LHELCPYTIYFHLKIGTPNIERPHYYIAHLSTAAEHISTMASSSSSYIPWNKVRAIVLEGIQVPICFSDSLCNLMVSNVLVCDYSMRFFMCENYEYDPPKRYDKDIPKVLHHTI